MTETRLCALCDQPAVHGRYCRRHRAADFLQWRADREAEQNFYMAHSRSRHRQAVSKEGKQHEQQEPISV